MLVQTVRPLVIRGDDDTAAFQAFKVIEVRMRKVAQLPAQLIGTDLVRRAFTET